MDERGRIALLTRIFAEGGAAASAGIELGIGDDAAVLDPGFSPDTPPSAGGNGRAAGNAAGAVRLRRLVWTIDEQVEGTHFRPDLVSFHDIGWRSFMAAASDLAAMGASPWCALGALVLPDAIDDEAFTQIVRGQGAAASAVGAPLVGGNLARGPALSITTTLLGRCERPITRGGAHPGDGLWLAGRLGLAAAGLHALLGGRGADADLAEAVAAWRRPEALIEAGRTLAPSAHAAVDISDGLARDAGHVAEESGVALLLDELALTADPTLGRAAQALGLSALDLALYGGEDYALLAASPVSLAGFRRVGDVGRGRGLVLRGPGGHRAIEARGFDHFAKREDAAR